MTPSRPYLLRGLYEWIVDNGLTPHLLVDIEGDEVMAPVEFAEGSQLVLNVSPSAVRGLSLANDAVAFEARFGGVPQNVHVPIIHVLAIYARENGRGMIFTAEDGDGTPPGGGPSGRPGLRVVK